MALGVCRKSDVAESLTPALQTSSVLHVAGGAAEGGAEQADLLRALNGRGIAGIFVELEGSVTGAPGELLAQAVDEVEGLAQGRRAFTEAGRPW